MYCLHSFMHGMFMCICTGSDTAQNQMRCKKYRHYQNWGRYLATRLVCKACTLAYAGDQQRVTGTKWFPFSHATVSRTGAVGGPSTQPEEEFDLSSITRTQKSLIVNASGAEALLEAAPPVVCAMARTAALPAAVQ